MVGEGLLRTSMRGVLDRQIDQAALLLGNAANQAVDERSTLPEQVDMSLLDDVLHALLGLESCRPRPYILEPRAYALKDVVNPLHMFTLGSGLSPCVFSLAAHLALPFSNGLQAGMD